MNIRDATFLTLGLMGISVAVRFAFGLDPMIVAITQPIFAKIPALGSLCTVLHGAAEGTMAFSRAGLVALGAYQFPAECSDPGIGLALIAMAAMAAFFVMPGLVMSTFAAASSKFAIFCSGANIALSAGYFIRNLLLSKNKVSGESKVVAGTLNDN